MTHADFRPIVENEQGDLEFLLPSEAGLGPRVASRKEPFPTAKDILAVLKARRLLQSPWEQYGTGRAAINLGAVYIVTNRLNAAGEALREAEAKFIEMLDNNNPFPLVGIYRGIAMARYNFAVLLRAGWSSGQFGPGTTRPEELSQAGLDILDSVEHHWRDGEDFRLLETALRDLQDAEARH